MLTSTTHIQEDSGIDSKRKLWSREECRSPFCASLNLQNNVTLLSDHTRTEGRSGLFQPAVFPMNIRCGSLCRANLIFLRESSQHFSLWQKSPETAVMANSSASSLLSDLSAVWTQCPAGSIRAEDPVQVKPTAQPFWLKHRLMSTCLVVSSSCCLPALCPVCRT